MPSSQVPGPPMVPPALQGAGSLIVRVPTKLSPPGAAGGRVQHALPLPPFKARRFRLVGHQLRAGFSDAQGQE